MLKRLPSAHRMKRRWLALSRSRRSFQHSGTRHPCRTSAGDRLGRRTKIFSTDFRWPILHSSHALRRNCARRKYIARRRRRSRFRNGIARLHPWLPPCAGRTIANPTLGSHFRSRLRHRYSCTCHRKTLAPEGSGGGYRSDAVATRRINARLNKLSPLVRVVESNGFRRGRVTHEAHTD